MKYFSSSSFHRRCVYTPRVFIHVLKYLNLLLLTALNLADGIAQPTQQWSEFPPGGKKRGMYIDEAHNLVFDLMTTYDTATGAFNYTTPRLQQPVNVLKTGRLRQMAFYNNFENKSFRLFLPFWSERQSCFACPCFFSVPVYHARLRAYI